MIEQGKSRGRRELPWEIATMKIGAVVARFAWAIPVYWSVNAVLVGLCASGFIHPPWATLQVMIFLPLLLGLMAVAVALKTGTSKFNWAALAIFCFLMFLTSGVNIYFIHLASAAA